MDPVIESYPIIYVMIARQPSIHPVHFLPNSMLQRKLYIQVPNLLKIQCRKKILLFMF